jgi:hypothetical protein
MDREKEWDRTEAGAFLAFTATSFFLLKNHGNAFRPDIETFIF